VPAISFGGGQRPGEGRQGSRRRQVARPTPPTSTTSRPTNIDPTWDPKGFVADGTLLFELGQQLANSRIWPEWKPGAEFKATRDKTKAQRK
jgi:hypothetical protein